MKIEKFEKFLVNLDDKREHTIHIRNLKQALNRWLVLKNGQTVTKFNWKVWLKSNMQYRAEKKWRKWFWKKIFK